MSLLLLPLTLQGAESASETAPTTEAVTIAQARGKEASPPSVATYRLLKSNDLRAKPEASGPPPRPERPHLAFPENAYRQAARRAAGEEPSEGFHLVSGTREAVRKGLRWVREGTLDDLRIDSQAPERTPSAYLGRTAPPALRVESRLVVLADRTQPAPWIEEPEPAKEPAAPARVPTKPLEMPAEGTAAVEEVRSQSTLDFDYEKDRREREAARTEDILLYFERPRSEARGDESVGVPFLVPGGSEDLPAPSGATYRRVP